MPNKVRQKRRSVKLRGVPIGDEGRVIETDLTPAKWPARIYVKQEVDPSDGSTYLLAGRELNEMFEDGDEVGLFQLVERRKVRVTRTMNGNHAGPDG